MKVQNGCCCVATAAIAIMRLLCSIQVMDSCAAAVAAVVTMTTRIHDDTISLESRQPFRNIISAEQGAGGQSQAGGVERHRYSRLLRGFREAPDTGGYLSLSEECCRADDCDPGLFTMFGLWTQCEVTPFSSQKAVCCKPFATPCDSDEACCSGYCDSEYTRCADTAMEALSSPSRQENTQVPAATPTSTTTTTTSAPDNAGAEEVAPVATTPSPEGTPYPTVNREEEEPTEGGGGGGGGGGRGTKRIDRDGPYANGQSYTSSIDDVYYTGNGRLGGDRASGVGLGYTEPPTPAPYNNLSGGYSSGGFGLRGSSGTEDHYSPTLASSSQPLNAAATEEGNSMTRQPTAPLAGLGAACETDYLSGTLGTVAVSEARVQGVAVDSQGNIFYSLGFPKGVGGTIRRAAVTCPSAEAPPDSSGMATDGSSSINSIGVGSSSAATCAKSDDELVYTGTGVILALAVDAADNVVFTMDDALSENGGVYVLPGVVATGSPQNSSRPTGGAAPAAIATDLGPFLPGVAVCPKTGDVFVARGHTGLTRVRKVDGFETKVEWSMADMSFSDGGQQRAPLMIWDIAVDRSGIVFMTTYVQGVVLKGIFPGHGGPANVRIAAGVWDSGVSSSSGNGGPATAAQLAFPKGIAIGEDGTVYVAEFQGGTIRRLSTSGVVYACVGNGIKGYTGDGGAASDAALNMPNAIAFAPGVVGGVMAIADFGNSAVRVITPLCP